MDSIHHHHPTNDNLMELLVLIDALRWASARRIHCGTALFRLCAPGSKTTLCRGTDYRQTVAKQLEIAGADCVMTVDLHSDQIQGF